MGATLTLELGDDLLSALDEIAARLEQTRAAVLQQAVEEWLEVQQADLHQIEEGVAQADAGQFATEDEVKAVFARYGVPYTAGQ
jgi:predicted transcriptional regulator